MAVQCCDVFGLIIFSKLIPAKIRMAKRIKLWSFILPWWLSVLKHWVVGSTPTMQLHSDVWVRFPARLWKVVSANWKEVYSPSSSRGTISRLLTCNQDLVRKHTEFEVTGEGVRDGTSRGGGGREVFFFFFFLTYLQKVNFEHDA